MKNKKKWIIALAALVLIAACAGWVVVNRVLPQRRYQKGVSLLEQGDYKGAIEAFASSNGYGDAADRIDGSYYLLAKRQMEDGDYDAALATFSFIPGYQDVDDILATDMHFPAAREAHEAYVAPFRTVGGIVTYGAYEQDADPDNGPEPIEWTVLDTDGNKALLITRCGVDCAQYNPGRRYTTWEECGLRKWLNGDFLKAAFDDEERQAIAETQVDNSDAQKYPRYKAKGGADTLDRIYLLSYAECWKYMPEKADRMTTATAYATDRGAYSSVVNGNCWWWLRSPGSQQTCASMIHYDGSLGTYLSFAEYASLRPVMWLDLDKVVMDAA